jgi:hypothetical protein
MNRTASVLAVAALLIVPGSRAIAQEVAPGTVDALDLWNRVRNRPQVQTDEQDYRTSMKAWAPVIGAKPSAGVLLGVAGNIAFFRGDPKTTHISSLVASLTFSTKKQTALTGRFALLTEADRWRIDGDNRAQWTSQDVYGLGAQTELENNVDTRFDFFRIHETVYRGLGSGVFGGVGFHFDNHSNIRPGSDTTDDQWADSAFVEYSEANGLPTDRQISAGVSFDLMIDTRDSGIDPRSGFFATSNYRWLSEGFLGGSSAWQLLHLDARTYVPLTQDRRQRLAFWASGDFVIDGIAPFFDLPATAMDTYGRSGRGYGEGRFRGEELVYGEVEYRGTLTGNGLVGMVAFLNATTVTNRQDGERLFDRVALGAGAGLRLLINKRSRTNLCLDIGAGENGSSGVYLAVQEAF